MLRFMVLGSASAALRAHGTISLSGAILLRGRGIESYFDKSTWSCGKGTSERDSKKIYAGLCRSDWRTEVLYVWS